MADVHLPRWKFGGTIFLLWALACAGISQEEVPLPDAPFEELDSRSACSTQLLVHPDIGWIHVGSEGGNFVQQGDSWVALTGPGEDHVRGISDRMLLLDDSGRERKYHLWSPGAGRRALLPHRAGASIDVTSGTVFSSFYNYPEDIRDGVFELALRDGSSWQVLPESSIIGPVNVFVDSEHLALVTGQVGSSESSGIGGLAVWEGGVWRSHVAPPGLKNAMRPRVWSVTRGEAAITTEREGDGAQLVWFLDLGTGELRSTDSTVSTFDAVLSRGDDGAWHLTGGYASGARGAPVVDTHLVLQPGSTEWQSATPLSGPRACHVVATKGGRLFAYGGIDGSRVPVLASEWLE